MSTLGSKAMAIGFNVMLLSVSAGIHFSTGGGLALLFSFTGLLIGANLVSVGVPMAMDDHPVVLGGACALVAFLRRNNAAVGLVLASCAVMNTPGSQAMTIGLTIMLVSVSAAMHLGTACIGLILCFAGILVGDIHVAKGVRMANGPGPIVQVAIGGARALPAFVCRNAAVVGLVMASCAVTVVFGEGDPMFCFGMFMLLLLGLTLVNIGARRE